MVVAQLEGEANNSAGRSRPPFSAHIAIKIPQYKRPNSQHLYTGGVAAAILLCALKIA